jgi:hypothetical protein
MLLGDLLSGRETLNKAFVAHIIAATPEGPRGHRTLSYELANSLDNLMLLCHRCHTLIDDEDEKGHPVERLRAMKQTHERRVAMVTGIAPDQSTTILMYAARIGENDCLIAPRLAKQAVLPERYPSEEPISLELVRCDYRDSDPEYWTFQVDNLRRQFDRKVASRIQEGGIGHVSTFAVGPQPLLIELGRLLSDIAYVDVLPLAREPKGWGWREEGQPIRFHEAKRAGTGPVALKLGISAAIADSRIERVLGDDATIYAINAELPGNDILCHKASLAAFRDRARAMLARIAHENPAAEAIHVFPAVPVAMAVELGRVWMPKADLPLLIYDEDRDRGGFQLRHRLGASFAR